MKLSHLVCALLISIGSITGVADAKPSFKQRHPIVHFVAKSAVKATVIGVGVAGGEYLYHKMTDPSPSDQPPQTEYVPVPEQDQSYGNSSHEDNHDDSDDSYHNHREAFRHGWK